MKKFLALALCLVMMLGCAAVAEGIPANEIKVGVILLHDENVGYDYAHILGRDYMKETLGLSDDQIITEYNIPENEECYDAAIRLVSKGCNIIFADSFGHEDYLKQAAEENPDVQFCHATGYQAASSGLDNLHNFMPSVYESRYVSGIVAGLKLAEVYGADTDAKIGYVGAFSYAEVVSGYTAFFLGVRSICPNVTMEVKYTGSWADQATEREVAQALIEGGCVLISQHADTTGAASACEELGVWHVGYNVGMIDTAPNTTLTSASLKWGPDYAFFVNALINGEELPADRSDGYESDAVWITELNEKTIAAGTQEAVDAAVAAIKDGTLHVFNNATFTVNGETVTSTADIEGFHGVEHMVTDESGVTYFAEQNGFAAPAFSLRIDGITELNTVY